MSAPRDPDVILGAWLDDGPATIPSSTRRAISTAVRTTPQSRLGLFGLPAWRPPMSIQLKAALAAVAVLVVAVSGFLLIGRSAAPQGGVGGPSSPSPRPTATAAPSAAPLVRTMPQALLTAGTYQTRPFGSPYDRLRITFEAPDGWTGFIPWGLIGPKGTGAPDGIGMGFLMAEGLFSDGCHWDQIGDGTFPQAGDIAVGPTVDDLVAALVAHPDYNATSPTDTQVGGYPATRLDLTIPTDVDLSTCDNAKGHTGGAFLVWGTKGNDLYVQGPGQRWRLWIVDADGARIVIVLDDYAGTPEADLAAAEAIVESITITP